MLVLGTVAGCAAAFHGAEPAHAHSTSARAAVTRQPPPSQLQSPMAAACSQWLGRLVAPALIGGACLLGGDSALAASEFTPDQEIVAQAWYKTDRNFVDRSFAGQDWFTTRQKMLKKKYDSRDEAYVEIRKMLASLNDKYTRFLTPSMYTAIYAVATGDVAGIGLSLIHI